MNNIEVQKDRLLETLRANMETHRADFELAWEGYRTKAMVNLSELLDAMKDPRKARSVNLSLNLQRPVDHTADYKRAIEMCDWHEGDTIVVSESEFAEFVQDDWHWKGQFRSSNVMYTGMASPSTDVATSSGNSS